MDFCPFHGQDCEESKMITIVELKKGSIKQTKICEECVAKHLQEVSIMSGLPEDPKDILDLFINHKEDFTECTKCITLNADEEKMSPEQRISILKNKMAAAIEVEDYETAAKIKQEIEKLRN
jgi:protein-arginine kinase activator protein McsA